MLKAPAPLVVEFHTVPRSVSRAVTTAPLIGAPLESVTVPTMPAVTSWPIAGVIIATIPMSARKTKNPHAVFFIARLLRASPPRRYKSTPNIIGLCYIAHDGSRSRKKCISLWKSFTPRPETLYITLPAVAAALERERHADFSILRINASDYGE